MEVKDKYVKLIISAMEEKGISNYRVAKATNRSESSIGRIIKGQVKPTNSTLIDILSYLGIEYDGLETSGKPSKLMEELTALKAENAKIKSDLETANQIIKALLPKSV